MKKSMGWTVLLTGCWVLCGWAGEDDGHLKATLNLGGSLTRGNSETVQGNAALTLEGETTGVGSLRAGVEGHYAESDTEGKRATTVENANAYINIRKHLQERLFFAINTAIRYDELARIDYRISMGPSLGAYLIKGERTALSIEAGALHVWEKSDGIRDDYTAYRLAERLDIALSDTAKLWQAAEYIPQANNFDDYRLIAEAGLEAAINAHLTMRLVLQNQYDSRPAEDVEKNDLTLIVGFGIKL